MKKDDFKKLFDYVDENENSSVEFQTVWRKAHRKKWVRKQIQSAGHNLAILLTILILAPIVGHYVINQDSPSDSAQFMEEGSSHSDYKVSGKIYNFPNQIVVKGESNLPDGTIINLEHLQKDGEKILAKKEVTTNPDGSFQITTDRLEKNKEYIIKILVYSDIQNEEVKNILGNRGEKIKSKKNEDSVFQYTQDGGNYTGLMMLGTVNKIDDTNQYVISEFLLTKQEFEEVD